MMRILAVMLSGLLLGGCVSGSWSSDRVVVPGSIHVSAIAIEQTVLARPGWQMYERGTSMAMRRFDGETRWRVLFRDIDSTGSGTSFYPKADVAGWKDDGGNAEAERVGREFVEEVTRRVEEINAKLGTDRSGPTCKRCQAHAQIGAKYCSKCGLELNLR